jgi:glycosyltransferase involved in cell wall biosynthesis
MRAGLPVVASDVGGVREAVEPGVTGFLHLRALRELIEKPELRAALGAAGRSAYQQRFRFEITFRQTCGLYRETLNKTRSL